MYSNETLEIIENYTGLAENKIGILSKLEVFDILLQNEGIIEYAETIKEMIQEVYGIDLDEQEDQLCKE